MEAALSIIQAVSDAFFIIAPQNGAWEILPKIVPQESSSHEWRIG